MACVHEDWRILIAQEKKGVYTSPYNYNWNTKQIISAWCADCGALKIDGEWIKPKKKEMVRKNESV